MGDPHRDLGPANPGCCWPANTGCCCCGSPGAICGAIIDPHRDLGLGGAPLGATCGPHRPTIRKGDGREGGDI